MFFDKDEENKWQKFLSFVIFFKIIPCEKEVLFWVCDDHWNLLIGQVADKFSQMADSLEMVTERMDFIENETNALAEELEALQMNISDQQAQISDLVIIGFSAKNDYFLWLLKNPTKITEPNYFWKIA